MREGSAKREEAALTAGEPAVATTMAGEAAVATAFAGEAAMVEGALTNDGREREKAEGRLFTPAFVSIVLAQLFSLTGEAVVRFALPLYVLNLTGSSTLYGIIGACGFIPYALLMPIGGILADRLRKRRVMAVLDIVMACAAVAYVALDGVLDIVVVTIAVIMVLYAAEAVYRPTVQAAIPAVVPKGRVMQATAIASQVSALTGMVGPVAGGLVFGFFGVDAIVAVGAVLFAVSCVLILAFVRIVHVPVPAGEGNPVALARDDLGQAAAFLKKEPVLWKTMILCFVMNLTVSACVMVGTPYLVTEVLGLSNQLMGAAEGVLAFGGLLGGLAVSIRPRAFSLPRIPRMLAVMAAAFLFPVAMLAFSGAPSATYGVIVAANAVIMAMASAISVVCISYLQVETPRDLVGKVVALAMAASVCATPIGQLVFGPAYDFLPSFAPLLFVAVTTTAAAVLSRGVYRKLR